MAGAHLRGGRRRPRSLFLVVFAALFAGLLLGAGVTLALDDGDDDDAAVGTTDAARHGGEGVAVANPAVAEVERRPITIAFAGDIYVERSLATRLEEDPAGFVGPFADLLRGADLAIGNLEAALVEGGTPLGKEFTFAAPPAVLEALRQGGFDVLSVANNHGMDYGADGLEQTLAIKRAQQDGIVIGIGGDEDEAFAPYVAEVGGQTVAVIAATQVIDADLISSWTATEDQGGVASAKRVDRLVEEIEAVRGTADTVVVHLHWGIETETCPSDSQQELAQTLADAGADLVIGGHAHRVQGGGRLGTTLVGYGLGNFLFGAVSDESAKSGVLLVEVDGRDVLDYEWVPGRISDRVPIPLEDEEKDAAVEEWNELRECTNLTE